MIAIKKSKRSCNFIFLNTLPRLFLAALFVAGAISVAFSLPARAASDEMTIVASKIVCERESDLPDWGTPPGGPDIASTTAEEYVSEHQGCHLESGWRFQWGDPNVKDPGRDFIGEAGDGWNTFGPTDGNGRARTTIGNIDGFKRIWVREALQDGYIPFSYPPVNDTLSAEMYCHKDVLNFDNYDYIVNPELGETYYCVAFNVKKLKTNSPPTITLLGDNPMNITLGDAFTDPGATATDTEDGDITSDIVVGGDTVNTSAVGTYVITYNVVDSEGAAADEVRRTVDVVSGGGGGGGGCTVDCGGGGGGGGTPIHLEITNEKVEYSATSTVLVTWDTNLQATSSVLYGPESYASSTKPFNEYEFATIPTSVYATSHSVTISGLKNGVPYYFRPLAGRTDEEVNGIELSIILPKLPGETPVPSTCDYLLEYIKFGEKNNPDEVRKLQVFLRDFEGFSNLAVTGIYDKPSFDAVSEFQKKYRKDILDPWALEDSTGYVYITTKKKVNEIYCQKEFPLSVDKLTEIEKYKALLERLRAERETGSIPAGEKIKKIRKEIGKTEKENPVAMEAESVSTSTIAAIAGSVSLTPPSIPENKPEKTERKLLSAALAFFADNRVISPFSLVLLFLLVASWIVQIALWKRNRRRIKIKDPLTLFISRIKAIRAKFKMGGILKKE